MRSVVGREVAPVGAASRPPLNAVLLLSADCPRHGEDDGVRNAAAERLLLLGDEADRAHRWSRRALLWRASR